MRYEISETMRRWTRGRQAAALVMLFEHVNTSESIHKHEERRVSRLLCVQRNLPIGPFHLSTTVTESKQYN